MSRSSIAPIILFVFAVILCAPIVGSAEDDIESYDAVKLNRDLSGNEILAASFQGKTIEVSGRYYGSRIAKSNDQEVYVVTFTGYAGLSESSHILCIFVDTTGLKDLKRGDQIRVRGTVEYVKKDLVSINASLVQ